MRLRSSSVRKRKQKAAQNIEKKMTTTEMFEEMVVDLGEMDAMIPKAATPGSYAWALAQKRRLIEQWNVAINELREASTGILMIERALGNDPNDLPPLLLFYLFSPFHNMKYEPMDLDPSFYVC
jgi:hypothetical protein